MTEIAKLLIEKGALVNPPISDVKPFADCVSAVSVHACMLSVCVFYYI